MQQKRGMVVLVLFLLAVPVLAHAETLFEDGTLVPPAVPSNGAGGQEDEVHLTLLLQDGNQQPVNNIHLGIEFYGTETRKTLSYVQNNIISFSLAPGTTTVILKGDSLDTPGGDYWYQGTFTLTQDQNATVRFLPVGSLRGVVYSDDRITEQAVVKVDCGKQYGALEEIETDKYGSFSNDYLPVGDCKVFARSNGRVGFIDHISIEKGEVANIEIHLDKRSETSLSVWVFLGILAATVVVGIVFFRSKSLVLNKKKTVNKRAQDLLRTLNAKEKRIVKELIQHGELYQNKLVHITGIPKTSLSRLFMALEQKKVLTVTKIGKTKKVKLTDWFLNKEK